IPLELMNNGSVQICTTVDAIDHRSISPHRSTKTSCELHNFSLQQLEPGNRDGRRHDRNKIPIRDGETIERDYSQRRRTVDQHIIVTVQRMRESLIENEIR